MLNDKLLFDVFEIKQEQTELGLVKTIFALIVVKYHTISNKESYLFKQSWAVF